MKKSALGRGLDALFPKESQEGEVLQLAISQLDPNPDQPRQDFDEEALNELAASIQQMGLLQPILAAPEGSRYRIIAGERRFRAAIKAGIKTVPVLVRSLPEHERRLAALSENLQREDLNPMEAAQAIQQLMEEGGLTQDATAGLLSKSRPAVANLLRLLKLHPQVQAMVREKKLTEGHARALLGLPASAQIALAQRAINEGLSVRALEALSKKQPGKAKPAPRKAPPELVEFQDRIQVALGVRARVEGDLKKGRIVLKYASFDELEGIYAAIARLLK